MCRRVGAIFSLSSPRFVPAPAGQIVAILILLSDSGALLSSIELERKFNVVSVILVQMVFFHSVTAGSITIAQTGLLTQNGSGQPIEFCKTANNFLWLFFQRVSA